MSLASDFITNLFTQLFKDEAAVLQPVADNYLSGILSDPSPDNVVAQSVAYQTQALAVLPKVESVGLFDTAKAIKAFIDAQVPALITQVSALSTQNAAGSSGSSTQVGTETQSGTTAGTDAANAGSGGGVTS